MSILYRITSCIPTHNHPFILKRPMHFWQCEVVFSWQKNNSKFYTSQYSLPYSLHSQCQNMYSPYYIMAQTDMCVEQFPIPSSIQAASDLAIYTYMLGYGNIILTVASTSHAYAIIHRMAAATIQKRKPPGFISKLTYNNKTRRYRFHSESNNN